MGKDFAGNSSFYSQLPPQWHGKPYYSLDAWCKNTYGKKLYKIAIDAGFTCPNRDGTAGSGGCIFCSAGGSGEFAVKLRNVPDVETQIQQGLSLFGDKKIGGRYIAYFQAYTNTYGPLPYLKKLFTQALMCESVAGISIATRPDCLPLEVLQLLSNLQTSFPHKFIWVELGLQTIHESTAAFIRRGYSYPVFLKATEELHERKISFIVHLILGLPGENAQNVFESIQAMNEIHPFGIKLALLHILKGTDLAALYEKGECPVLSQEEYISLTAQCIGRLSPDITIHRLTGDGPKDLLIAPLYTRNKRNILNTLHRFLKEQGILQGSLQNLSENEKKGECLL